MASFVPSMSSFKKQGPAADREKLEKDQAEAIAKAVNPVETSVKEKHIRSAIIGTWQEHGANIFWTCLGKMPLPSQVFMCWKAMFLIHKLLREGHPKALEDSFKYRQILVDMYKFWELSPKGGYGILIARYLKVLIAKLDFHKKNSFVPGNLNTVKDDRVQYASTDVNDYFQLSVEVFDYMDALIELEKTIFSTLDRYHSNSQIAAVQCRICPFPVIVQECSGLYVISVDLMYRLHSSLPVDTLDGHRERFYAHFKELKSFYFDAGNMAYVKSLVVVPTLPENPPSFLPTDSKGVLRRSTSYEGPKTEKIPLPSQDPKRQSLMEPLTVAMSEPVVETMIDESDFFGSSLQDGPPPPARFERYYWQLF
ncbi:huntingtin-interacting protein 1-like [Actinia tenebrosa]|uniref:Huntingtin-interacting protein 1-like n=1 Tax=Actinia tenebrosa TaxID=6105 RepID=A0A6P8IXN1_ACTTE|nr:huntingtin-interacting protein 1-like [Actinia tenebrosa]